eukprot:m.40441 g.40441  ORF g.40441 m.40441 type:complete len:261 (+) comp14113_c0_seq1:64-846(+)
MLSLQRCVRHKGIRSVLVLGLCLAMVLLRFAPEGSVGLVFPSMPRLQGRGPPLSPEEVLQDQGGGLGGGDGGLRRPGQPCRNTQQSATHVADDQGLVCAKHELDGQGCCPLRASGVDADPGTPGQDSGASAASAASVSAAAAARAHMGPERRRLAQREQFLHTAQYSCQSCRPDHCCRVYEYCVSCCQHSNHTAVLRDLMAHPSKAHQPLLRTAQDRFELCTAACRTNSMSVQHENKFRDAEAKHCFGPEPAALVKTPLK